MSRASGIALPGCLIALALAAGCGGSSSHKTSVAGSNPIVASGANVAPLIVDAGPVPGNRRVNVPFTTVVVCAPGTANCVTIDHVAIDTGSTGLRIPASLLSGLGLANVSAGAPEAECVQFLDNTFFFGAVKSADVKMGGSGNISEVASSVPILVMGDSSVPTIPSDCTGTENDTVAALGENGVLGVGLFQFDCDVLGMGNPCTSAATVPPGTYYSCPNSSCSNSAEPTSQQVRNPVSLFATDNNGVILEMPAVPVGGETGISAGQASLVFGIGTESNNGLSSSAVVLPPDSNPSDVAFMGFTTVFRGVSYPHSKAAVGSFLDSGSNGIFFLDQPTSGIPSCGPWYCPASTDNFTAVNNAADGHSSTVNFNVSNANTLFSNNGGNNSALSALAGPHTTGTPDAATQAADGFFDWGLSFFYGRNVYVAIWQVAPPSPPVSGSSVPAGPFWAY